MEFPINDKCSYYFKQLCDIPHGSFNEKAISDYLVEFAKAHNLKYVQDDLYNVVMYKTASNGYENSAPLLIQAHMDMVCEANKATVHDFKTDPLKLDVRDGWLYANGTTLGADDGTGVAYMLTILDDDSLAHPALECVFTVQEEVGLIGAAHLDSSLISAKRMICLDGGGEVSTCISSAGGIQAISTFIAKNVDNTKDTYSLFVSGLTGGHSGGEIHKEKGNANKIAVRIIKHLLSNGIDLNIVTIDGGLKDNAIPRENEVVFTCNKDFSNQLDSIVKAIKTELEFSDNGLNVSVNKIARANKCFDDKSTNDLINYLFLMPNGMISKSMAIEGLTTTSLNLGIIKTNGNEVKITNSIRSAIASGKECLVEQIKTLASLFEIKVETSSAYPGWNYNPVSDLRDKFASVLKKLRNVELKCEATHGGNECGIFNSYGVEDIITFGPVAEFIHTPDERLNVESFIRSYEVLVQIVKECK